MPMSSCSCCCFIACCCIRASCGPIPPIPTANWPNSCKIFFRGLSQPMSCVRNGLSAIIFLLTYPASLFQLPVKHRLCRQKKSLLILVLSHKDKQIMVQTSTFLTMGSDRVAQTSIYWLVLVGEPVQLPVALAPSAAIFVYFAMFGQEATGQAVAFVNYGLDSPART